MDVLLNEVVYTYYKTKISRCITNDLRLDTEQMMLINHLY